MKIMLPRLEIVEDSDADFIALARFVSGRLQPRQWHTAEEALIAIERGVVDLNNSVFVVDLRLPEASGSEFVRTLRERQGGDKARVLLWSEVDSRELARQAHQCGADGFGWKPWSVAEYLRFADRCVGLAAS